MPTRFHIFSEEDAPQRYIFNYTFLHDFGNILAENFTLKVILPEGATNIKVLLNHSFDYFSSMHLSQLTLLNQVYTFQPLITSVGPWLPLQRITSTTNCMMNPSKYLMNSQLKPCSLNPCMWLPFSLLVISSQLLTLDLTSV